MLIYRNSRVIKRTVGGVYWLPHDLQQDPPVGWCDHCGAEVYRKDRRLCGRCCERLRGKRGELRVEN